MEALSGLEFLTSWGMMGRLVTSIFRLHMRIGGDRGTSTSPNLVSGSGGHSNSVSILWNFPAHVLPFYQRSIFENIRRAALRTRENLLMENHMYRMQIPSTCRNPIRDFWLTGGMMNGMIAGISLFVNNLCGEFPLVVSVSVFYFPSSLVWVATNLLLFGSLSATILFELSSAE